MKRMIVDALRFSAARGFDVVPEIGPARATWTNPKYPISGGAFWTSFTLDEPMGVLYVPAGNPAPDFDSELRTGDNLYTDSVIAIDAATDGSGFDWSVTLHRWSMLRWPMQTLPQRETTMLPNLATTIFIPRDRVIRRLLRDWP